MLLAQAGRTERTTPPLSSGAGRVAVLYPGLDELYRAILTKIIEGVEVRLGVPVSLCTTSVSGPKTCCAKELFHYCGR